MIATLLPLTAHALLATCTVGATSVAFGAYDPSSGTALDSTGTITVNCTTTLGLGLLVNWDILLSTGGSGGYSPRRLQSGANTLNYNLYSSAARTAVWGDTTASTVKVSDSVLVVIGGISQQYTVYGRVPALQNVAAGNYTDTITITLNYN